MNTESNESVEPVESEEPSAEESPTDETSEEETPEEDSSEELDDDETPAKKNWVKFAIVGLLAVVLVGAGIWALTQSGSGWAVGDCASIKLTEDGKTEPTSQSCGSDDGAYKVAKVLASDQEVCPEEGLYETAPWDSKQLCLMPNFEEGKCYVPNDEGLFKKGGCTGEAVVKVVKRIEGKPEKIECPGESSDMQFSEPEVVYCLGTGDTP